MKTTVMSKPNNILDLADRYNKEIKIALVLISMLIIMLYGFYRVSFHMDMKYLDRGSIKAVYLIICALWTGSSVFLYFSLYRKKLELYKIAAIIMPVLALFYFLAFTPNTVPDELYHFASAYKVSNIIMLVKQPAEVTMIPMRLSDIEFLRALLPNSVNVKPYDFEQSYYIVQKSADLFCKDASLGIYDSPSSIDNAPLCFVASGIGVTIARLLNLGPVYVYYMGQLMNVIVTVVAFCLAIKITPVFKESFFVMGMLPMVLHEAASYSYDPIVFSAAALFAALILKAIFGEDKLAVKDIVFMSVLSAIIAPSKIVYFPLVFLAFFIPKEKIVFRHPLLIKCIIAGAGILALGIIQVSRVLQYSTTTFEMNPGMENYSISWILDNPLKTVNIFMKSILENGQFYLTTIVGSSLAWFQVDIPMPVYVGFLVLLFVSALKQDKEEPSFKFSGKLIISVILLASAMLVMLSMFVASTWVGCETIVGVQGRYFLPLLPFVFWLIRNDRFTITPETGKNIIFATNYAAFVYVGYCFLHLLYII